MKRSKLEMYADILSVLACRGPLKLTHIMYKVNINCSFLSSCLDFLIKQGLVEERTLRRNSIVYLITQNGLALLKTYRELKQALLMTEEENRLPPILL